ncbi:MAG TPA: M56 family metallopeptidase [Terracidiphilus sp.]|nr:M56 family metallopeptidase [Terracidiphilus sp.]
MHSFSGLAAGYLVNAVWETALIFWAAWLASRMLRRLGPQAEHIVWVTALFISVIAPALPLLRQLTALVMDTPTSGGRAALIVLADPNALPARAGVFSLPQSWLWSLLIFYAVSTIFFACRLLLSLRGAVRLLKEAAPAKLTAQQEQVWRVCREAFSLERAQILVTAHAAAPVALGLRRPVLLLPAGFADGCTPEDFLAAITHECAHLRRRDFQKNLFYETLGVAIALHPLIWAIKSRIAQTREMVCDAMAAERHVDARSYARSLLRLATMIAVAPRVSTFHAIGIFDAGILEKRIMRIKGKKQQTGAIVRCALTGSAAAILLSATVGAAAMAVVVAPRADAHVANATDSRGHIYKVGNGVTAPVPLNKVDAKFPKSARKDKSVAGGVVLLRMIVDAQGEPQDVHVVHSYRPDFDAEAVKAAKQYRFKPAMRDGKPVAVSISVEVNFKRY